MGHLADAKTDSMNTRPDSLRVTNFTGEDKTLIAIGQAAAN
jgi:hypothetical protein